MTNMRNMDCILPVNGVQPDYSAEIAAQVRSGLTPKKMREEVMSYHEKDTALALELLTAEERGKLFKVLTPEDLASVLEYAQDHVRYIRELNIRKQVDVLSEMEPAAAADALRQMESGERTGLLELMAPEVRCAIDLLGSFDENEIGSKMSTNFISIPDSATIKEAMSELIRQAAENDNITVLYAVDGEGTFCGAIDLKDLIIAREGTALSDIVTCAYPYVYAGALIEDCMAQLMEYSEESVPVLDEHNRLIGVVTARELLGVVEEELSEDYARLAGLTAEEDLAEPIRMSVGKRLPWLGVLLAMGVGVSTVVGLFESVVAQLPVIMCFQSLILDMAGNVGTQSLAVAIRVLMDKQLSARQKAALVWKEARIGLINGLLLGGLSFAAIGAYLCLKGNTTVFAFAAAGCLGAAMLLAMVISALSGTLIPIAFQKLGVDPAVASGPLITTVNDLVAVVAYYGLAWLILIRLLGMG